MIETGKTEPDVIPPAKSKRGTHLEKFQVRFEKGVSGNPGGRPPSRRVVKALLVELDAVDETSGLTGAERVAKAWMKQALKGNIFAIRDILDRTEGRISAAIAVEFGDSETAISSAKQKLMQKLIRVEAENAAGSVSVTISQKRLPFRPMRRLLQVGEGEHSET